MIPFSYRNKSKMVVLRCVGPNNFFLEKVIFPFELVFISAPDPSKIEIWGNNIYGPSIEERLTLSSSEQNDSFAA